MGLYTNKLYINKNNINIDILMKMYNEYTSIYLIYYDTNMKEENIDILKEYLSDLFMSENNIRYYYLFKGTNEERMNEIKRNMNK
jgi:hypothetical protein